jgi:hypothetical protein
MLIQSQPTWNRMRCTRSAKAEVSIQRWQHVIANAEFVSAPAHPGPRSIYDGKQLILIKADQITFSNGDLWKCLSCGVPTDYAQQLWPEKDYPHELPKWNKDNLETQYRRLRERAIAQQHLHGRVRTRLSIYWPGNHSTPREMRIRPDDTHVG